MSTSIGGGTPSGNGALGSRSEPGRFPLLHFRGEEHDSRTLQFARRIERGALIDFRVEQEDTVYPMVPAGADLHKMIRRPSPIVETAKD